MTKVLTISENQELVSKELNQQITAVLSNKIQGFQKAFIVASAIQVLKDKLTVEFMKPIMSLQGSRLGFLTDKDKTGGYDEETVKSCLIDAVLLGLQPTNNEFNIIGSNMYPTKEGFGSLLKTIVGLRYNPTFKNPIVSADKSSANVVVIIDWELNGEKSTQEIDFPMKSNAYASSDALIGKATRKARRWLYNHLSGTDIADGDVQDISHEVIPQTQASLKTVNDASQYVRIQKHIEDSETEEQLKKCYSAIKSEDFELLIAYKDKEALLKATK